MTHFSRSCWKLSKNKSKMPQITVPRQEYMCWYEIIFSTIDLV